MIDARGTANCGSVGPVRDRRRGTDHDAGQQPKDAGASLHGLRRHEQLLHPFMAAKQSAAAQFAGLFAPKSRFDDFLRNQVTNAFATPFVAKLVLGRSLLDRIDLPDCPVPGTSVPLDTCHAIG